MKLLTIFWIFENKRWRRWMKNLAWSWAIYKNRNIDIEISQNLIPFCKTKTISKKNLFRKCLWWCCKDPKPKNALRTKKENLNAEIFTSKRISLRKSLKKNLTSIFSVYFSCRKSSKMSLSCRKVINNTFWCEK